MPAALNGRGEGPARAAGSEPHVRIPRLQRLEQIADAGVERADRAVEAAEAAEGAVADRLDLADRNALAAHGHGRRILVDVDPADHALHLCRDSDRLSVGARSVDRQGVAAVWPGRS